MAIASISAAFGACGGEEPHGGGAPIEIALGADEAGFAVQGGPSFGGMKVSGAQIEPATLRPGEAARLTLEITGLSAPVMARVAVEPPRSGSRQVARGGVGAPPLEVPEDARVRAVEVELSEGSNAIDLPALPVPWHPRRALVTLSLLAGAEVIPATAGPRRADGAGVLALAPVQTEPTRIDALRTESPIAIDGVLDEPPWREGGTALVESLEGEPWDGPPTHVWAAWDDTSLYVAAHVEDTDVWSDFQRHDDPLWDAEVFEVFVFGDDDDRDYLELQVSPRGVTFDARFARHRQADRAWTSRFVTAARVDGTLDRRDDRDRGWVAEVAIPWDEICAETAASCPPRAGASLRMNAFRFERPAEGATVGLALSPTRVPDFHAARNAAILTLK
jgi:hypothetical protein